MKYKIINIINKNLTDIKLKQIINEKLYKVIKLLELSDNSF